MVTTLPKTAPLRQGLAENTNGPRGPFELPVPVRLDGFGHFPVRFELLDKQDLTAIDEHHVFRAMDLVPEFHERDIGIRSRFRPFLDVVDILQRQPIFPITRDRAEVYLIIGQEYRA